MIKTVFSVDGFGAYVGLHDPDRFWNGWAVPYFTFDVVKQILTDLCRDSNNKWEYDPERDVFTFHHDPEITDMGPEEYGVEWLGDGGEKYYCIPDWCWVAEDEKTFYLKDKSGIGGSYEISLVAIVSDPVNKEQYESQGRSADTLIDWAMNAEEGDDYHGNSFRLTRIS